MPEPRQDMLPDESETTSVVKEDSKSPVTKDVKKEASKPQAVSVPPEEDPVVKTKPKPKGIPYSRYQEKVKELKEAKKQLKDLDESSAPEEEDNPLEARIKALEEGGELDKIVSENPVLADKNEEFGEFRDNNPHLSPQEAKAVFLANEGVSDETPVGLEKPTSGPKKLSTSGFTPEQIEDIRIKEPRRYERLVQDGKFDKVDWSSQEE